MSDDHHADERDRKRHKRRYGHTTTNPGMRLVMRDLAQKDQDAHRAAGEPGSEPVQHARRSVRIERRPRKAR